MNAREALIDAVREAYMEIFPTDSIESKLDVLEAGSYVAVTCSPTRGVDVTLDMCERLALRGFKVVPHVAAKMVRNRRHLREILARLNDLPIVSLFVPGGDAPNPLGGYETALQLLRDIAEFDHGFEEIGVAAHPEGHPSVPDDVLLAALIDKQAVSNYLVTQMAFDADSIGRWIHAVRAAGVTLPIWLGLPGESDRAALLKTSLRIGVGDSLRYLRNRGRIASALLASKSYRPDELLFDLGRYLADPACNIRGFHLYCFNQIERSERWRRQFLRELGDAA